MDGQCRDVIDYHVDYTRQEIETNSTHDFTLKAYSANGLKSFVGVKEVIVGGGFVSEIGTSTKWTVIISVITPGREIITSHV